MDRAEIEARLFRYAEAVAADTPIRVWTRNGGEWTPAMGAGPVEIVDRPVPLQDHEREAIREILDGDPIAIIGLRDSLRAHVLSGLWHWGHDTTMLRGVLAEVWQHNHQEMLAIFPRRSSWSQPTLRQLFEATRFPVHHLPERVSIYRGIGVPNGGIPSCTGISWSLRRDCASWFALHLLPAHWTPYLLTATVSRERVAAHLTGRNEDEVIVFGMSVKTVSLTSDMNDMRAGQARELERRRARDAQIISGHLCRTRNRWPRLSEMSPCRLSTGCDPIR